MSEEVTLNNSLAEGTSGDPGDDDDDKLSLTSTAPDVNDSDEEFVVETVLAEKPSPANPQESFYLIKWEGFPLHQCTWEPEENLGTDLKTMWEEKKAMCTRGELEAFDVEVYNHAQRTAAEEKAERHRRRNAKRLRMGLPMTLPYSEQSPVTEEDSSSDEASEDLHIENMDEPGKPPAGKGLPAKAPTPPTVTTKGIAQMAEKLEKRSESRRPSTSKPAMHIKAGKGAVAKVAKRPASAAPSSSSTTSSRVPPEHRTSTTGYQGTARKPSLTSSTLDSLPGKGKSTSSGQGVTSPSTERATAGARGSTMKAKKSAAQKQPAPNIFVSGKVRKQRANLQQAMSDPSKAPKLFSKARYLRLAEKRSRDMEDLPIALDEIIPLNTNIPDQATSNEASAVSPVTPVAKTPATSASLELRSVIAPREDAPVKKKRKSVRWVEDEDPEKTIVEEPEQMDVDSPPTKPKHQSSHTRLRSPPPPDSNNSSPQKLLLDQHRPEVSFQSLDKTLIFGTSAAFTASFSGIPRDPAQTWISSFVATETIEFHHTCFSKTIINRLQELVHTRLSDGTITSSDNERNLEAAAEYLRAGLLGLYYAHPDYSIIVYPTKCDDWNVPGQEPASPSEDALRYMIFYTAVDCRSFLKPYTRPSTSVEMSATDSQEPTSARQVMMNHIFDLDYATLLPKYNKLPPIHGFFLAFPPSKEASMLALYHWLRDCNPHCLVYSNLNRQHGPGAWTAFWAGINENRFRGAVIVHEMLLPGLFRFPNLSENLIRGFEEYWCFSESLQAKPIHESISPAAIVATPGSIQFKRLFPARTVILVTPSFLVGEPQRAFEFFDWYLGQSRGHYYRLVTAWNIHEYLLDLATEKSDERQKLLKRPNTTQMEVEFEANLRRLSKKDCECRYRTASIAFELQSMRMTNTSLYGAEDLEDDSSPVIYADSSIDPNDEQSLVNWFGWWTTMHFDQFKKFHVLGSSSDMNMNQRKMGQRRIRLPIYTRATINDPDAALRAIEKMDEESEAHADPNGDDLGAQAPPNDIISPSQSGPGPLSSQSDAIKSARDIHTRLEDLINKFNHSMNGTRYHWTLYKFPVSWIDREMADHFGDWKLEYTKVSDWWKFAHMFADPAHKESSPSLYYKNTYVGFFYTITEDWNPETTPKPSGNSRGQRHPWLLIYRPVNPGFIPWRLPPDARPYTKLEIIIWDPSAKTKFPDSQVPTEKDLLDMQRRAIDYIREHTEEKNPGSWIDHVWLGGFDYPAECESPYPYELTLKYLKHMLGDLRSNLPQKLRKKGFREVMPGKHQNVSCGSPNGSMAMDVDGDAREQQDEDAGLQDEEGSRIIFHPPRATRLPSGQRSLCTNRLYEETRLARAHGVKRDREVRITYTFVPTEEWYSEQRREGRSFEHINIQSWNGIFKHFKIGTPQTGTEGATASEVGGESPRSS